MNPEATLKSLYELLVLNGKWPSIYLFAGLLWFSGWNQFFDKPLALFVGLSYAKSG